MEDHDKQQSDPGMIIKYNIQAVHSALAQQGSPVAQGASAGESVENFESYVWNIIVGMPCDVDEHCVGEATRSGVRRYVKNMFHRLPEDVFFPTQASLGKNFCDIRIRSSAVVTDSVDVPNPPLGTIFQVVGGTGQGKVAMEPVYMSGIFRPEFF